MEIRQPKVLQLLGYLSQQAMLTPGLSATEKALFSRDAFCLLWQTGLRGINASEIRLEDPKLPGHGRNSVAAYLSSSPGTQLQQPGSGQIPHQAIATFQIGAVGGLSTNLPVTCLQTDLQLG